MSEQANQSESLGAVFREDPPWPELLVACLATAVLAAVLALAGRSTIGAIEGGPAALLGGLAGYATVPALLCSVGVWIVLWLVTLRSSDHGGVGGIYFLILFGVALVVSICVLYPVTRKNTDEAEIEKLNSSYSEILEKDRSEYTADMGALRLNEALRPAELSKPNFASYRDRSAQAHEIIRKYRDLRVERASELESKIRKSDMSGPLKPQMRKKFDADWNRVQPLILRNWQLEDDGVSELDDIVVLLDRERQGWSVSSGKLMFSDPKLLNSVQNHISKLHKISAQEAGLQRELDASGGKQTSTMSVRPK